MSITYHLVFIPVHIRKLTKKKISVNYQQNQIRVVLLRNQRIVSNDADWHQLIFVQDILKYPQSLLFFTIQTEPPQQDQWTIRVMLKQQNQPQINNNFNVSQRRQAKKDADSVLGSFTIDPNIYADVFNEAKKSFFQENAELSQYFSIDYQVFIQRSREALDSLISEWRGGSGEPIGLASAFKKRLGKRKVRFVELVQNRERSIKQQEFEKQQGKLRQSIKIAGFKVKTQPSRDELSDQNKEKAYHSQKQMRQSRKSVKFQPAKIQYKQFRRKSRIQQKQLEPQRPKISSTTVAWHVNLFRFLFVIGSILLLYWIMQPNRKT